MKTFVGTSGYSYKQWKGSFYPEEIRTEEMLAYYGERFGTVEINNTFYRLPSESVLSGWAEQVPDGFRFVLKASRRITHNKRLKGTDDTVDYLYRTAAVLGGKLGPVLFQLPPNLKKDIERLRTFLELLTPLAGQERPAAMEFRHESWFDDEVYDALRAKNVALCTADMEDGAEGADAVVPTADRGYLRLRRVEYGDEDLARWVETIRAQPWREAYVFFKHEEAGTGPRLGRRFMELLEG